MSILRIVSTPADVGFGGYEWFQASDVSGYYDKTRVDGAFHLFSGHAVLIDNEAPAATEVWYHFRYATRGIAGAFESGNFVEIRDANSNIVARMTYSAGNFSISAVGTTTSTSGTNRLANGSAYSIDIQVIVAATTTVRFYINGALFADRTVTTGVGFGIPRSIRFAWTEGSGNSSGQYVSEVIIADEDTRGMRLRELRPSAFGIFQEWDGAAAAVRDSDLATGISTDTANRRVSFGVTNLENIGAGDIINRVVAQTYAQRGETGIGKFNHFFRFRDGTVTDSADITLAPLGAFYREEFLLNPKTGLPWVPEDFRSLQTGIRSRA